MTGLIQAAALQEGTLARELKLLAEQKAAAPVDGPLDSLDGPLDSSLDSLDSSADRIRQLEKDLLAAQGEAATLRATVAAQEAHIESLKAALDKAQTTINQEQAIRMASLQKRLPTPGRGFFAWLRGKKDE